MGTGGWAPRAAVLMLGAIALADAAVAQDAVPKGTVAYFAVASCPVGWSVHAASRGRLTIGTTEGKEVGAIWGQPLTDREDRTHEHCFAGSVVTSIRAIAAGPECCNTSGAKAGIYRADGTLEAAPSGLPFIQLLACRKD